MGPAHPSLLLFLQLLRHGGRGRPSLAASVFHAPSSCGGSADTDVLTGRRKDGAPSRRRLRVSRDGECGGRGCGGGVKLGMAGIGGRRAGEGRRSGLVAVHGSEVADERRIKQGGGTTQG
jgi:hypothetical protein